MKSESDPSALMAELRKNQANKRCFDCQQGGTTYAVCDLGIFLCSICAGLHREFSHRVKGLSTSNFTLSEVENLQKIGNERAAKIWLSSHNVREYPIPDPREPRRLRQFIKLKYVDKRFYQKDSPPPEPPARPALAPPKPAALLDLMDDAPASNAFQGAVQNSAQQFMNSAGQQISAHPQNIPYQQAASSQQANLFPQNFQQGGNPQFAPTQNQFQAGVQGSYQNIQTNPSQGSFLQSNTGQSQSSTQSSNYQQSTQASLGQNSSMNIQTSGFPQNNQTGLTSNQGFLPQNTQSGYQTTNTTANQPLAGYNNPQNVSMNQQTIPNQNTHVAVSMNQSMPSNAGALQNQQSLNNTQTGINQNQGQSVVSQSQTQFPINQASPMFNQPNFHQSTLNLGSIPQNFQNNPQLGLAQNFQNNPQNQPRMPPNAQNQPNFPQNTQNNPQNQPGLPQNFQNNPQNQPGLPQNFQNNPQNQPGLPQNFQNNPQNQSGLPQNFQNNPQNQPGLPQNFQNNPQNQPGLPQNFQNNPQNQPGFPPNAQNQPNFPQNFQNNPQNQLGFPPNAQNQPNFPQNTQNNPQNQPGFPPNAQNQPNFPQNTQNNPQNQPGLPQNFQNNPQNQPGLPQNTQNQANFPQSTQNQSGFPQNFQNTPPNQAVFPQNLQNPPQSQPSLPQNFQNNPQNQSGLPPNSAYPPQMGAQSSITNPQTGFPPSPSYNPPGFPSYPQLSPNIPIPQMNPSFQQHMQAPQQPVLGNPPGYVNPQLPGIPPNPQTLVHPNGQFNPQSQMGQALQSQMQGYSHPGVDPFSMVMGQNQPTQHLPESSRLAQQYMMQAQNYQLTCGTPYPYSFEQWSAMMTGKPRSDSFEDLVREQKSSRKNPFDTFMSKQGNCVYKSSSTRLNRLISDSLAR